MKATHIYHIDEIACINCGSCRRFCPVDAIPYERLRHQVDMAICVGCTICYAVCPVDAVEVTNSDGSGQRVLLDVQDMDRVRLHAWIKGPFYQMKRRQALQRK
jgi:MinD superfamily P-loop ATPase